MRRRYRTRHRIKRKKSLFKRRSFWMSLFSVGIVSGISYIFLFSPYFQLEDIRATGTAFVESSELQMQVRELLSANVGPIKTKSILLLDSKRIKEELLKKFPALADISIQKDFPRSLVLVAQAREKIAVFCTTERECFALDPSGVVFEKITPSDELIISLDGAPKKEIQLGEKILEKELLASMVRFQKEAAAFPQRASLTISKFTLASERKLQAYTSEGWEIYIDPSENQDWQLTKLQVVLDQHIPLAKRKNLEYVDLRFGDHAFVKYR